MYLPDYLYNRDPESHKGDYGHALLVAGSYGKMGAAVLAAKACLRAGVGLLTVHVPRIGVNIMQVAVPEAMLSIDDDERIFSSQPKNLDRYDAIAIGPGLGTDDTTQKAVERLICEKLQSHGTSDIPMLIDADGLNILSRCEKEQRGFMLKDIIVTPHSKEYQRLFGDNNPQNMADKYNVVIVKKSHRTVIYAPHAEPIVNDTGNAAMATAGSGDVLTGIMLGLLSQEYAYRRRHEMEEVSKQHVAALAVKIHGAAGDRAANLREGFSVIASDIVESLGY